jgi:hypothetical protein
MTPLETRNAAHAETQQLDLQGSMVGYAHRVHCTSSFLILHPTSRSVKIVNGKFTPGTYARILHGRCHWKLAFASNEHGQRRVEQRIRRWVAPFPDLLEGMWRRRAVNLLNKDTADVPGSKAPRATEQRFVCRYPPPILLTIEKQECLDPYHASDGVYATPGDILV